MIILNIKYFIIFPILQTIIINLGEAVIIIIDLEEVAIIDIDLVEVVNNFMEAIKVSLVPRAIVMIRAAKAIIIGAKVSIKD